MQVLGVFGTQDTAYSHCCKLFSSDSAGTIVKGLQSGSPYRKILRLINPAELIKTVLSSGMNYDSIWRVCKLTSEREVPRLTENKSLKRQHIFHRILGRTLFLAVAYGLYCFEVPLNTLVLKTMAVP
jgi:hypothetical protein